MINMTDTRVRVLKLCAEASGLHPFMEEWVACYYLCDHGLIFNDETGRKTRKYYITNAGKAFLNGDKL